MWIFEKLIFGQWASLGSCFSICVPNLVQKCWQRPKLRPKIEIQDGGCPPSWIFQNLISDQWVSLGVDFPSGYQIRCKNVDRWPNYGQKSKFKMAAVRHLGILISPYRTTHEVFSLGYISLSNFVLIRYIVLKMGIWFFCRNGLKCLFTPKNFGFGGLDSKNNWSSSRPPKCTSAPETTCYEH